MCLFGGFDERLLSTFFDWLSDCGVDRVLGCVGRQKTRDEWYWLGNRRFSDLHHFFTDLPDCSQAIAGSARWISTASYCATPICSSTAGLRSTAERRAAAESDGTGCWPAQLLRQLRQQTSAQCQVLFRVRTHRLALVTLRSRCLRRATIADATHLCGIGKCRSPVC